AMATQPHAPPFTAHQLFFDLQAAEPIHLHAHNGSAVRGMLYRAVLELADGDRRAPDLRFISDPAIRRLLALLDEDNLRGRDVPRPYVIEPPILPPSTAEGGNHIVAPGQTFSFGITLFGDAMEAFPVLVMAMKYAEGRGLGRVAPSGGTGRGRFRVVRAFAQNPLTRTTQEFLAPGERWVITPQTCIVHDDVARQATLDAEAGSRRLRIHFHTPMTLKAQGEVIRQPSFSVLIHRLIERLTQLSTIYGGAPLPCLPATREAKNALLQQADAVRLLADRTRWVTVRGRSDRTRASTNLSGFLGSADFEGDFAPFFPILRWGEFSHAGNHAVKGNGLFRIQVL
ncbi:MAG: CRISPR system precrRNA processing endoribonuclease RAMP protein Cas6, partial [Thermoflexales bacterium]|nr:CRISPR system precrRNA processing endoribonuclease RAMP protein Cas6 [Thermoflexales bacterium]